MATLKTDSPLSQRIARSFLQFLNSVEPSAGVDSEALDVAKECLAEVFKVDQSSLGSQPNSDSLIDIFGSREANAPHVVDNGGVSDAATTSLGKNVEVLEDSRTSRQDRTTEQHSAVEDELFGQFFGALEKIHYFRRMPDGSDDQVQLDRATYLFHNSVEEMQIAGCQTFDQKSLAETFKSRGNKAVQSKLYAEAIELYTFAIALCEDNAVYFCNRAAAYTQIHRYAEAVKDCLKSIEINPNYSKAYSRLGFAYYAQGKYRDAIDKGFMRALELDPNNDSVKENIRVAERKLREEQQRGGPGQSSTSTSHGQSGGGSGSNSTGAPTFTSMPFNVNGLPFDITGMLRNMAGNAHPENGPEGESEAGAHNDPGVRIDGNINVNVDELPEELSGALRSMMGMFSGGGASHGNQQDDSNGRSSAS
ncbi:hypothetical protein BUALT_Bualt08G0120100 [Buddleja alternifolia]|uniref:SGTA homodimerisation domain-containing protein n=1 Tax=Buddleja alternifolia TaxID=168488 RepID=A0AAV6XGT1_9LAMI|nr:hypothetical protein BUALT_Bualt08G0120100 [Buddleja alternifolia]